MRKLIIISAVILTAGTANAMPQLYVSEKLAYGHFRLNNLTQYEPVFDVTIKGTEENDWAIGSRTAVGIQFDPASIMSEFRGELEFGIHSRAKFTTTNKSNPALTMQADMWPLSYGANIYYDLKVGVGLKPYIGAGLGWVRLSYTMDSDDVYGKGTETNFYWNFGLGVSYALTSHLDLDAGYRYTNYGQFKGSLNGYNALDGLVFNTKVDLTSHEILLGARYAF
ncbi:MAG: outer membrane beta-barrel protein [Alphaproteobacteria bacterium]|nr:outer membrane beta-barrel protein [Alphaproteobacteria bacterium]